MKRGVGMERIKGDAEHELYELPSGLEKVETNGHLVSRGNSDDFRSRGGENKIDLAFVMTMIGFSCTFIIAEVTPLFLATCFTVVAYDLDAMDNVVFIIVTPYIATGAVAPFVGTLSDMFGRRGIILASLAMVTVSFAILGATPDFAGLIVGQVLCGAAIGIQLLTVIAAASELVPVAKRGAVIGLIVCGFFPFAPAPLYGAMIASHNWRYIFLVLGLWSCLSFVILAIFYRPPPRPNLRGLTRGQMIKRVDFVGIFLSICAVVLFTVGINWGGQYYDWSSSHVIGTLVVGIILAVLFVGWEYFYAAYPMFPRALIGSPRHFTAISVLSFTSGVNFIPLTVFWTLQVFTTYKGTFHQAGVWLLPLGFCIAGGAVISAVLITVAKRQVHWVLLVFCVMQTIGMGCMSLFKPDDINSVWAPMIFGLIGVGAVLLPSQVVFGILSPPELIGTSVALSLCIRMIAQCLAKAMFYNIFKHKLTKNAPAIIGFPAIEVGFTSVERVGKLVVTMTAGPLEHYLALFPEIDSPEKLKIIVDAGAALYSTVFPLLYKISIPFGIVASLSCLGLWGLEKFITDDVAVLL